MRILSLKRLFVVYSPPLILTVFLLSVFGFFRPVDQVFLDSAFQLRGTREPGLEIAIVAISRQDFELGAPRWPWPRSLMARLIDQVSSYEPAVIAIDILYTERTNTEAVITREQFSEVQPFLYQALSGVELRVQTSEETRLIGRGSPVFDQIAAGARTAREQDQELVEATLRAISNGVSVVLAAQAISDGSGIGLAVPYPELSAAAGDSLGLVGIRPDQDGVLRRYLTYGRDKEGAFVYGLALVAVAEFMRADLPKTPLPNGVKLLGRDGLAKTVDNQFLVNFPGPPGTYTTLPAHQILRGEEDLTSQLKGKIVFIGVTDPSAEDLQTTPFSGTDKMSGVEFHAAAADTLLSGSFIRSTARLQETLMLVVLGLGAIVLGRFARPLFGFSGALALTGGLLGTWLGLFAWANHSLPITSSLIAIFAGYAFAIVDRVSVEQLEKQQARSMLSRYLAPGIVKELLKNPVAAQLGGKRAELTVLFSDIRGFTSIAERLAPEEVIKLLNEYLTVMTEVIFRHEGTVDKFQGDGLLAIFGAPQPHDDDPERAIRAAIEMRDQVAGLEERWEGQTQARLQIGIGINSGQAVAGNIGSQRRMDYTIIGDTVNLAARLQELTKEYDAVILISGSTQARAKYMCQLQSFGSVEVRGRQQLVDLYEVLDLKADVSMQGNTFPQLLRRRP